MLRQTKDLYTVDGYLYMRHIVENNVIIQSHRFNKYGDIVASGSFVNCTLQGCGCKYDAGTRCWIKSPHFINDAVYGIAVVFDVNNDIIFYGYMYNNEIVRENISYHPFLEKEYNAVTREIKEKSYIESSILSVVS